LAAYIARSASAISWSAAVPGSDSAAPIEAVGDTFSPPSSSGCWTAPMSLVAMQAASAADGTG
jgi:hypothetical protein